MLAFTLSLMFLNCFLLSFLVFSMNLCQFAGRIVASLFASISKSDFGFLCLHKSKWILNQTSPLCRSCVEVQNDEGPHDRSHQRSLNEGKVENNEEYTSKLANQITLLIDSNAPSEETRKPLDKVNENLVLKELLRHIN